jgi:lipopolysaccharide export system permease protein
MKRLDRYLVREMFVPFLIGQGAVVLMLIGTVLYNNADTFLNARIPALGVAKIAFYFMPYLINLTMPVAVAIAASLMVSRLARDTEITVMRAAGISLKRIFLPVFVLGFLVSIGDFYFGEKVVPWATLQYEKTMSDLSRNIRMFVPQEQQVVQSGDKKYTAYIGRIQLERQSNRAKLFNVTILKGNLLDGLPSLILAGSADYDNGVWTLYDAKVIVYEAGGMRERFTRSKRVTINFQLAERSFNAIYLQLPLYSSAATRTFKELGEQLAMQRKAKFVDPRTLLEYHFKLSVPFSCLVFALACPPLALKFAKQGNFMGVLLSIILVFVYWNTLLAAKILGSKYPEVFPPIVAGWGQNILFAAIGLFVLWRGE